ncbi:MAG: LytR family transcriptional regulator [Chloroflexi bacterium]|nr:MAG: LytR family transcriptional regulator [Chloroflexota bacterium]
MSPHIHYFPRASRVVAGFVLAGIIGLVAYFLPLFQSASTATGNSGPLPIAVPNPLPTTTDPFTVLLLGSDDDAKFAQDRVNTQSMILIRVDPTSKNATMLSIPRDLWVPIPGQGMGKISTAYQTGGPDGAVAAVESNSWSSPTPSWTISTRPTSTRTIHGATTAPRCFLARLTSTASTHCSTFAHATATFGETSPDLSVSSSC